MVEVLEAMEEEMEVEGAKAAIKEKDQVATKANPQVPGKVEEKEDAEQIREREK